MINRLSLVFAILLSTLISPAHAGKMKVPIVQDLQSIGAEAKSKNIPILLVVTQEHCPFCHTVKEEILEPMLLSKSYDDKVLIRELVIDEGEVVTDFSGDRREARKISEDDYKAWITPTLLYISPDGRELSARILGVNTIELYSYYVDAGINEALDRQRGTNKTVYKRTKEDVGFDDGSGEL